MVSVITGPYEIKDVKIRVRAVATNKVMMGPIRGSGGMIATFILERVLNLVAGRLGLDQFSIRKTNLIGDASAVYKNPFGVPIPPLRFADLLETARGSRATRALVRRASSARGTTLTGYGLSFYIAESAPPSEETVRLELTRGGGLRLYTAVAPTGQGSERTLAAMVTKKLNPGRSTVEVRSGDTTTSKLGEGTQSSRSITYAGSAALLACQRLVDSIVERLVRSARDESASVAFREGVFRLRQRDGTSRRLDFVDVANELGTGMAVDATYRSETSTFSSGCHISLVEVDPSTGSVKVVLHLTFDDFGMVLDRSALTAQTEGAVMQSIGEAFQENAEYDRNCELEGSYLIPSASATPKFSHSLVRLTTSHHLHGARGAGEAGRMGSLPAIVNAVENALAETGNSLIVQSLPITSNWISRRSGKR